MNSPTPQHPGQWLVALRAQLVALASGPAPDVREAANLFLAGLGAQRRAMRDDNPGARATAAKLLGAAANRLLRAEQQALLRAARAAPLDEARAAASLAAELADARRAVTSAAGGVR